MNLSRDADGLLVCLGGNWHWSTDVGCVTLAAAASCSLDEPLPKALLPLFGKHDPWRSWPALTALLTQLARTTTEQEVTLLSDNVHTSLQVCTDEHSGRGLHVHANTPPGTQLLTETAHAAVLWPAAYQTHCHFCLLPLPAATARCCHEHGGQPNCFERYCDEVCARSAWEAGHSAECGSLHHVLVARTAVLCVRAMLVSETSTAATVKPEKPGTSADTLCHERWGGLAALLRLHDHAASMPASRLSQLRFHAHLGFAAYRAPLEARGCTEADLCALLRIALTNVFAVSGIAIEDPSAERLRMGTPSLVRVEMLQRKRVGEVFFARAALLNHSCAPNTTLTIRGRQLELRAACTLEMNQQCFSCYGPQAGFSALAERREALGRLYYFHCLCDECVAEAKADETSLVDRRARSAWLDAQALEHAEGGRYAEAAEACKLALVELRHVFPPGSSQLAYEEAKLGRLLFNAYADRRAAAALRRAARSCEDCFGSMDEDVAELRRLAAMCTDV